MTTTTDAPGQVYPASGASGSDGGNGYGGPASPTQGAQGAHTPGAAPGGASGAGQYRNDNPARSDGYGQSGQSGQSGQDGQSGQYGQYGQSGQSGQDGQDGQDGHGNAHASDQDPFGLLGAGHWSSGMPGEWREALLGFDSPQEAMDALQRGAGHVPAMAPDEIDIRFPEGVRVNQDTLADFRHFCVESGLSAAQAQGLADWQLRAVAAERVEAMRMGEAELRTRWGGRYEEHMTSALRMTTMLDRHMGGRLAPALAAIGGANDPVIIEALHALSTLVSEDSLGGARQAGGGGKPMSTEEFLKTEVFGASQG